jgi:hypothetical protein
MNTKTLIPTVMNLYKSFIEEPKLL